MRKLAILDLDYTILNTLAFKHGLADAFFKTIDEFNHDVAKYFKPKNLPYNHMMHLRSLEAERLIDWETKRKILRRINQLFANINQFVFSEAVELLELLKLKGYKLILVSFGEKKFQLEKIKHLKCRKFFSKILVTDKKKYHVMQALRLGKNFRIFIINDNAQESFLMLGQLAKAQLILLDGPYSKNIEHQSEILSLRQCIEFFS
jgi:FMN phosphatase YigB (HAD superfamily)